MMFRTFVLVAEKQMPTRLLNSCGRFIGEQSNAHRYKVPSSRPTGRSRPLLTHTHPALGILLMSQ